MRKLNYQYHMQLSFSKPVRHHRFTLRCFPSDSERQKILEQQIQITPAYLGGTDTDSFGNLCLYGVAEKTHMEFSVAVSGTACVNGGAYQPVRELYKAGMFRYPTGLTAMGPELYKIYEELPDRGEGSAADPDKVMRWMDVIFRSIQYVQGVTQVTTTAEEAAGLGTGVCQDYSHILLALLRKDHIPCRYVAGMMAGEGASHAWVEVSDGENWVAFDPTNNCRADDGYICISHGRDAKDCTMNQGYYYGSAQQLQQIHVLVEESLV